MSDGMSTAHAGVMVLVFVVLLPVGVLVLRFGDEVRWHGVLQGVSLLGGLVGAGLGVSVSFSYQRVSPSLQESRCRAELTCAVPRLQIGPPGHRHHRHDSPHRAIVRSPPSLPPPPNS